MTGKGSRFGLFLAFAGMLVAAGCTGTDVLETANQSLQIEVAFAGQPDPPYDCVDLQLGSVYVRPLDGNCAPDSPENAGGPCLSTIDCGTGECLGSAANELIGASGIEVVNGNITLKGNLTGGACVASIDAANAPAFTQPAPFTLTAGLYEISTLNVRYSGLYTDDPASLVACPSNLEIATALGHALRFTVPVDSAKTIRIVAHIDVWEDVLNGPDDCVEIATLPVLATAFSCENCDAGVAP